MTCSVAFASALEMHFNAIRDNEILAKISEFTEESHTFTSQYSLGFIGTARHVFVLSCYFSACMLQWIVQTGP